MQNNLKTHTMKKLFLFLSVAAFSFSVSASNLTNDGKDKEKKETKKVSTKDSKSCCKSGGAKACAKSGEEKACHDGKAKTNDVKVKESEKK